MAVSMNDLRTTFGVSGTVSLSQLYRGGSLVPDVSTNNGIPSGSAGTTINLNSFSTRTNLVNVSYQLIGGGGGGGWANQELDGQQNGIPSTAGGTTSISGALVSLPLVVLVAQEVLEDKLLEPLELIASGELAVQVVHFKVAATKKVVMLQDTEQVAAAVAVMLVDFSTQVDIVEMEVVLALMYQEALT